MTRKLPEPQAGSKTRMRAMRLRRFSSLRALSPPPPACAQVVEEQRIEHLEDVRHAGVVHAEGAAFLVVGHRLDHGAEDVGIDLRPVEAADVEQIGAGDPAEARHVHAAGEKAAVDVGKVIGPGADAGACAVRELRVHGAEQLGEHLVRVRGIPRAHLLDRGGEQAVAVEDAGVLGEEAEDQPGEEMVEVLPAGRRVPVRVLLEQLDVELVEAAGGPDVEGVFADLLDRGDAGQRQEEAEVIGESRRSRRRPFRRRVRSSASSVCRRWPG